MLQCGASVDVIARRHGVNANQLFATGRVRLLEASGDWKTMW